MKLSAKHGDRQTTTVYADFTGGLNTAAQVDAIAENQLAECVNMEVDFSTARLKTVEGTADILSDTEIFAVVCDLINSLMLVVDAEKYIRVADFNGNLNSESIGKLSGELYPKYCAWKNGVLIASGGHLQYFDGNNFLTIDTPPADDVFVRSGRVVIYSGSWIYYSGVGDENDWYFDNNRENSAKFIGVGYKDGGKLIGLEPLSNNILALKDNRYCYRIIGEYPEWQIDKSATQIDCKGRLSYCAAGDEVFVLGNNGACLIQNSYYGNFKPENIAAQVESEIHKLPKNAQVRYLPPLYQVWCIGKDGYVLVYDLRFKAWFKRQFNANVVDVFNVGDDVFIVKNDRVSKLDKGSFKDNGKWLCWKFLAKRMVGHYDYLLKHTKVSVTMLNNERYNGHIFCGKVRLALPTPRLKTYENDSPVYENVTRKNTRTRMLPQPPNGLTHWNYNTFGGDNSKLYDVSQAKIFSNDSYEVHSKNHFRSHFLDIGGQGEGGRFILQSIIMDIADV